MRVICVIETLLAVVLSATAVSAQITEAAKVSGLVLDASGGTVANAEVSLTERAGATRAITTEADGTFTFDGLPAGSYDLTVTAPGFQEYRSATFAVTGQQGFQVPNIALVIAAVTTSVTVQPTEVIAAQQVKAEEQQRVFGVFPNFYTSYVWNAAPLDTKQKFSLAVRTALDPVAIVGNSIGAGIEQARNAFPGYGRGAQGYAKRWGALFANERTNELLSRAVFPSLFRQDPRYFYQGSGSTWSRIRHAVGSAFVVRGDRGHVMPNYSPLLGGLSSGVLSNLYYPESSRGAGLIFTNTAISVLGRVGQNLFREFVFKRVTKHVPGSGKPASDEDQ